MSCSELSQKFDLPKSHIFLLFFFIRSGILSRTRIPSFPVDPLNLYLTHCWPLALDKGDWFLSLITSLIPLQTTELVVPGPPGSGSLESLRLMITGNGSCGWFILLQSVQRTAYYNVKLYRKSTTQIWGSQKSTLWWWFHVIGANSLLLIIPMCSGSVPSFPGSGLKFSR